MATKVDREKPVAVAIDMDGSDSSKETELQEITLAKNGQEGVPPEKHLKRSATSGLFSPGSTAGLQIVFKGLNYHVPSNQNKKERISLLKGLNGFINPNELTALMGPSGSGKTTLLDVLAGRKNAGILEGTVLFGSQKPSMAFLRRFTGYVEQFDTLIGILTVKEMLLYTAEMKRPVSEPYASKAAAVDDVLDKLALDSCKDTLIGNAMVKGISGGQAKRTNIGIALVTNPRVLFLDEPTSGLDSYTSNEVMRNVRQLAVGGVTICATIHSPTAYCFSLFSRLMMLVKGRIVYFGPISGGLAFAQQACPNLKEMEAGYNDAEFLVDFVTDADRQGRGNVLADFYDTSALAKENDQHLEMLLSKTHMIPKELEDQLNVKSATATPWWWGLWTIMRYRSRKNYKDPNYLGPRIADKILISLLIMTLYLLKGDDTNESNLTNIAAVLFMWVTLPAFGAAAYIPSLVLERSLFIRERADGLYHVITYLLSKILEEVLLAAIVTAVCAGFVFYGIQLQGAWVIFWLVYFLCLINGITLAYFIAALSPTMDVANALLPLYAVTLLFFAGFLFRFDNIPPWWKWYSYLNFLRYAWSALMRNQFDAMGDPPFLDTTVTDYYNIGGIDPDAHVGFLAIFFGVFFLLAWTTMSFRKYADR
uniref:ABC transporter domain-containing protein n=1 Tax=Dunaliella tertiolecta TaxID=3047 RepID=A0A7S3VU76_DUNTE|eukprot:CAMPEP_0202345280 /NCGR_PEP_ID=MMETSP1126-20121109/4597_1 /ASSEMBLY_ACC=CAM_ASM_000457 /TAXON_ID=3047 /ORGANISM="Dunaliella tertiolecta, Strain CCMP1320" /LENGTH=649 /DNA_ID=CAMNT_0048936583 /DNA_START=279 /DNA_END=2228 /DNA_ORIENTATION=+